MQISCTRQRLNAENLHEAIRHDQITPKQGGAKMVHPFDARRRAPGEPLPATPPVFPVPLSRLRPPRTPKRPPTRPDKSSPS